MQATSLNETASVSWVDAVVTKGFAPEETHTQQIPTWTIPGYTMKKGRTSGTDAAHLQDPETLTLGKWGRDLDVHFTLGVRDMEGMKFSRDEGNRMCMADRARGGNDRDGDMGYQDDFFKWRGGPHRPSSSHRPSHLLLTHHQLHRRALWRLVRRLFDGWATLPRHARATRRRRVASRAARTLWRATVGTRVLAVWSLLLTGRATCSTRCGCPTSS